MSIDWKKTLAKVAPGIATALGGPMAGVAVGMATKALGIDDGDESALSAAVASGDPQVLLKLKNAENDFLKEMKALDVDVFKAEVDDRKDARQLAIKGGKYPQVVLSVLYTLGYFWTMYAVFAGDVTIADNLRELAGALIGIMSTAQMTIMRFWFGGLMQAPAKPAK